MQHVIFVYGTLRRGGSNHHLLKFATFLGFATTLNQFTLYDFGAYPGMIDKGNTAVAGEVYLVSAKLLKRLDVLEQTPTIYTRILIDTPYGNAWTYVLARRPSITQKKIVFGDWFGKA